MTLKDVEVVCSRCKCLVKGFDSVNDEGEIIATAGYYRGDGFWKKYMKEGESNLCEQCMFDDETYRTEQGITEKNIIGLNEP